MDSQTSTSLAEMIIPVYNNVYNNRQIKYSNLRKKKRHPLNFRFQFKKSHSSSPSSKQIYAIVNSQMSEMHKLKLKLDKLEEEHNQLKNQYETLSANIQTHNGLLVPVVPVTTEMALNDILILSNNNTNSNSVFEECNNTVAVTTNESEPAWIVEKSKCKEMVEKAHNQISSFLSYYLPEIYNSAELISPAYFPEATEKHQEINAIIKYFWKNQSSQDFYAKAIEKELQSQRYKVTRKFYYLLKTKNFCIMSKDGKVHDCMNGGVKSMTMLNGEISEEWLIPNELSYDDYVIGAKKDEDNNTQIYKLDLVSPLMKVIYTKRK